MRLVISFATDCHAELQSAICHRGINQMILGFTAQGIECLQKDMPTSLVLYAHREGRVAKQYLIGVCDAT
jgi:hypothetical protein